MERCTGEKNFVNGRVSSMENDFSQLHVPARTATDPSAVASLYKYVGVSSQQISNSKSYSVENLSCSFSPMERIPVGRSNTARVSFVHLAHFFSGFLHHRPRPCQPTSQMMDLVTQIPFFFILMHTIYTVEPTPFLYL